MNPSGIFIQALNITNEEERASYLEEVSRTEAPELVDEVRSLLQALKDTESLSEHPFFVPEELKNEAQEEAYNCFPQKFSDYTLLERVGRGGMGVIYKASQERLQRTVALKMIKEVNLATRDDVVRFYAEAQAAACLNHPGIVPVYEAGSFEGQHYFTMALVEGINLNLSLIHI